MEPSTPPAATLSPEERRRRGIELCGRLTGAINEVAVDGMGLWDQTWTLVSTADTEFMMALFTWERSGSSAEVDRVAEAYDAVMSAWRRAVDAFQEHPQAGRGS